VIDWHEKYMLIPAIIKLQIKGAAGKTKRLVILRTLRRERASEASSEETHSCLGIQLFDWTRVSIHSVSWVRKWPMPSHPETSCFTSYMFFAHMCTEVVMGCICWDFGEWGRFHNFDLWTVLIRMSWLINLKILANELFADFHWVASVTHWLAWRYLSTGRLQKSIYLFWLLYQNIEFLCLIISNNKLVSFLKHWFSIFYTNY